MRTKELHKHCALKSDAQAQLKMAITELNFSAPSSPCSFVPQTDPPLAESEAHTTGLRRASRAYDRILKVARTIADLAASADIQTEHVSEAIQYRNLDRQFWI